MARKKKKNINHILGLIALLCFIGSFISLFLNVVTYDLHFFTYNVKGTEIIFGNKVYDFSPVGFILFLILIINIFIAFVCIIKKKKIFPTIGFLLALVAGILFCFINKLAFIDGKFYEIGGNVAVGTILGAITSFIGCLCLFASAIKK